MVTSPRGCSTPTQGHTHPVYPIDRVYRGPSRSEGGAIHICLNNLKKNKKTFFHGAFEKQNPFVFTVTARPVMYRALICDTMAIIF